MSPTVHTFLTWAARLSGVAVSLFLAVFALDAFHGQPALEAIVEFLLHLAPSALVGAVVAAAWRRPWIGAAAFGLLAAAYVAWVPQHRLDWILAIAGPLAVTAALFAASAITRPPPPLPRSAPARRA